MNCASRYTIMLLLALSQLVGSCNKKTGKKSKQIAPKEMNVLVQEAIIELMDDTDQKTSKVDDSTRLYALPVLNYYYDLTDFAALWSDQEKFKSNADSLLHYLEFCKLDGLFREDYQYELLHSLKQQLTDSLKRKDALLWARADLLFSDAFVHLLQDLKQGRLQPDSLSWKYKVEKQKNFFSEYLEKIKSNQSLSGIIQSLQPAIRDYQALRNSIPAFIKDMDTSRFTYLYFPYKDSLAFLKKLITRLGESGIDTRPSVELDSTELRSLISRYQKGKGMKPTGAISATLVSMLNNTDLEKFKRIAISLDKYKQLPSPLPEKYIWVNLPSYQLQVWEKDSLVLQSKTIIGKPNTPTPDISSEISNLVIYPTWTVPNSIIVKEILPGLKKNPDYLARKGLGLYDNKGDPINPQSVKWAKYTKGIPYFVRQSSGDNNALGVIKFNFSNPYMVYLHDTNQRYLFKNKSRSLSHGCVRVEDWRKLAFYIVRNDSIYSQKPGNLKLSADSIITWIAQKQKHNVGIQNKVPLFLRYITCEGINGNIKFHEDVYNKDKVLREKYFALK